MLLVHYAEACADLHTVRAGRVWYARALKECESLARTYGKPTHHVAGIVAALSPRMTWRNNLNAARAILAYEYPGPALRRNVEKAERIRDGEAPDNVLRGPKVCAFYRALLGDTSAVVVDGWMLQAIGYHTDKPSARQYRQIAQHIAETARIARCKPAIFQAIIWCHVRGAAD